LILFFLLLTDYRIREKENGFVDDRVRRRMGTMELRELIKQINKSVEELDFATARKYIETNITILNENKNSLKSNARELLEFLTDKLNSGYKPLTRQEMATISAINSYASKFEMRQIKMIVKEKAPLFLRQDVVEYLNADAKVILEGMGIISNH
jgi:hypothetical protein